MTWRSHTDGRGTRHTPERRQAHPRRSEQRSFGCKSVWRLQKVRMRNLIIATIALVLGVSASLAAADQLNPAFFGTWKLNTEKSKADSGAAPKDQTVTIEPRGESFLVTFEVDNGDGTK